jgi:rhodanese-related sulfurtransferase
VSSGSVHAVRIEELLDEARSGLERLSPADALAAAEAGAVLVDIRDSAEIARGGSVPGAVAVPRNVLEWRCAPDSRWRDERVSDPSRVVVVICEQGYQSSLAAATLKRLGLARATDVEGGFQAWRAAGLPVDRPPAV